jgi:ubiquinone/menaquinone biosynthesis C-methylase UbiE
MSVDTRRLAKARALLPHCIPSRGGVWADLGCGDGVFTTVIQEIIGSGGRVVGVDKDAEALRRLRRRFERDHPRSPLEVVLADFRTSLVLPPLDGFVVANALHFVDPEPREGVFDGLAALLKHGGQAVVVEYDTRTANPAVPFPLDPDGFFVLAKHAGLEAPHIAARVRSSFLGEMYAGVAIRQMG